MTMLLVILLIMLVLPERGMIWVLARLYRRSLMKVAVDSCGKKLKSMKDERLTKKYQAAQAAKEDKP